MLNIKQEIKSAFCENKIAIYISIFLLVITILGGYILQPYLHSYLSPVVEKLTDDVKSGVITLTFPTIFLNNVLIVFRMFIFGIFFCISGLILAYNGFFVGYYIAGSENLFKVLLLIIPHGIFEFSSCIIATASGFVLFHFIFKLIYNTANPIDGDNLPLKTRFTYSLEYNSNKLKESLILLGVAVILMAIAGFIEVYLTIPIANFVLSIFG